MFGVAGNVRPEATEVVASTCGQREFYMPPSGKHLWERRPMGSRLWAADGWVHGMRPTHWDTCPTVPTASMTTKCVSDAETKARGAR